LENDLYQWLFLMQNDGTISIEDMKNAMQDNDQAIEMFNDFFQSMYWERLEIIRSVIPAVIIRIEKTRELL
jgi:hypothetical protein